MVVRTPDGNMGHVSIGDLREGVMIKTVGDMSATLGIDELSTGVHVSRVERWLSYLSKSHVRLNWLGGLGYSYKWLNIVLAVLVFLALIRLLIGKQADSPLMAVFLVVVGAIVVRALLFGLLDASSWNGAQARYMAPMIPAFAWIGFVGMWVVVGWLPGRKALASL